MWLGYTNGSWQEIPPPNRGALFGDGLFETLHIRRGRLLFSGEHLRRLRQGLLTLQLEPPLPVERIFEEIQKLHLPYGSIRAKVVLVRQGEGTYAPPSTQAYLQIGIGPLAGHPFPLGRPQRLVRFPVPFLVSTPWSPYKTLSSLGYVQAAAYAQAHRCEDALLLSAEGYLAETSRANLFFWDGKVLRTPSLRTGCIAGVLRTSIFRLCRSLGIPLEEGTYPPEILLNMREVFTTNVIQGIVPVLGLQGEGTSFQTGEDTLAAELARHLSQILLDE